MNGWGSEEYEREIAEGFNSEAYDYDEDGNPTGGGY
jgi:hypothetical protein